MDEGKDAMNTKQKNSVNPMKITTQTGQADGKLPTQLKSAMSTYEWEWPADVMAEAVQILRQRRNSFASLQDQIADVRTVYGARGIPQ